MARREKEAIDVDLLVNAKAQGFKLKYAIEDSFLRGDTEEFWYISPSGEESERFDTFDEFEDALGKVVTPVLKDRTITITSVT